MSVNYNVVKNAQTVEYGKFVQLDGTLYPSVSVTRIQPWDTSDAFPENTNRPPLTTIDVYPKFGVLTHITNPEDIKVSLSAENINVNLADVENILNVISPNVADIETNTADIELLLARTNTLLNANTGFSLDTVTNTNDIENLLSRTNTLLNTLTANTDSLEINTDDVEALVVRSNTLLNTVTAIQTVKQDQIITLLDTLTANTDEIESNVGQINSTANTINSNVSYVGSETNQIRTYLSNTLNPSIDTIRVNSFAGTNSSTPLFVNQGTLTYLADSVSIDGGLQKSTTTALTNTLTVLSTNRIFQLFGISTAAVNQYIQIYDIPGSSPTGVPAHVFMVPANSNFSFDFNRGLPMLSTKTIIVNSLTPIDYNPGNSDMHITLTYN